MTFKEWLTLTEAGHIILSRPQDFILMIGGKPTMVRGVAMIDPRLEFYNIPVPEGSPSKAKKFLGDTPFSLPLVGSHGNVAGWIVSDERMAMMSGGGRWDAKPVGVQLPVDWPDRAIIMGVDGRELVAMSTFGAQQDLKTA